MTKTLLHFLLVLLPASSWALVLVDDDNAIRIEGEKIYRETKDRIEVPDEDIEKAPRYSMGKGAIPVSLADVIRLSDEHFQKTLGLSFSEESGFVDVNLSWTGSLGDPLWWYHVRFKPHKESKLRDSNRWDYQLAVLMNGKVYPSTYSSKELVDNTDPIKASGIPALQKGKREEMHLLEKEIKRLRHLPKIERDQRAGVYTSDDSLSSSTYVFYPDGCFFSINSTSEGYYKVKEDGKVFTTYTFGPNQEKIAGDTYVGVIRDGKFIWDQGDYQMVYHLKEGLKRDGSAKQPASSVPKDKK